MVLHDALTVEDAIGGGDRVAERRQIMVDQVIVRLVITIVFMIGALLDADITKRHPITQGAWPWEPDIGSD